MLSTKSYRCRFRRMSWMSQWSNSICGANLERASCQLGHLAGQKIGIWLVSSLEAGQKRHAPETSGLKRVTEFWQWSFPYIKRKHNFLASGSAFRGQNWVQLREDKTGGLLGCKLTMWFCRNSLEWNPIQAGDRDMISCSVRSSLPLFFSFFAYPSST